MRAAAAARFDWDATDLVIFDMDGTLYDQRRLRARMLGALLADAIAARSLRTLRILREFRRQREILAEDIDADFLVAQYAMPARRRGCAPETVRALVAEWMERRPLPLLPACRRPGIARLFDALARNGKRIGILSDYPAVEKLAALGLTADFIVAATDPDVGRPKPDPHGLHRLLRLAGVAADRAVLIGDRADRDGAVAARANMRALILARAAPAGVTRIASFGDRLFEPLFTTIA